MTNQLDAIKYPELIIGICGPIGVDLDNISDKLQVELRNVGYKHEPIKITDCMRSFSSGLPDSEGTGYYAVTKYKIKYADELCKVYGDAAVLARIAVHEIATRRKRIAGSQDKALDRTAFIVRQLKRPQEVDLFRKVYGRQFLLISAYGSAAQRRDLLARKLKGSLPTETSSVELRNYAEELMDIDQKERREKYGQDLRDTFHRGDVFIDGVRNKEMKSELERFIQALFGRNDVAPTKWEYGMYAAKSASLRSSDLSRQVGAAIFTSDGELITQGCNEVPKAFGGTYWDQEEPDWRDIRVGSDRNDEFRSHLLRDLFERLLKARLLSQDALALGSAADIVENLTKRDTNDGSAGALIGADVMDLTEFGRVVHAEMCAICDAARLGKSVKGGILFCTTFPCHNCTKHILAAGIRRVVYMEPYPKSRAKDLHENEIEVEENSSSRVEFLPFLGISPYRYRDIFQKGRRKDRRGKAIQWYQGEPRPMIEIIAPSYLDTTEPMAWATLLGEIQPT